MQICFIVANVQSPLLGLLDIDDNKVTVHTGDEPYIEQFVNKEQLHSLGAHLWRTDTSSTRSTQRTICDTTGLCLHSVQCAYQQKMAGSCNLDRCGDNYALLVQDFAWQFRHQGKVLQYTN
eukprot:3352680-Amphidinium_carterae.3